MSNEKKPTVVADEVVVSLEYHLKVDGELFEESAPGDPLMYIHGTDSLVPGLEKELAGMAIGDSKHVFVPFSEGYGEYMDDAVIEIERSEFPEDLELESGMVLEMEDEDGNPISAEVVEINGDMVTLDFNEPLAGKDLEFDVKILDLRRPTAEELEHGHVHDEHAHE